MAQAQSQFLLKILNGSQIGAEVALDSGEFSFGKGSDADLQLADLSLQDIHGRIRLVDGKLEIRAEGGRLSTSTGLELEPGDSEWHEIAQLDSVSAGTTRFAVGGADANWAELVGQGPGGGGSSPRRRRSGGGGRGRLALLGWPVAIGALSLVALFASGMIDLDKAPAAVRNLVQDTELTDAERVRRALDALPFARALAVDAAVDGRIDVNGYVETLAERRAIQTALLDTGVPVTRNVQVRDVLRNDIRGLIESQGVDLDVEVSPDGTAVLSGQLMDSAKAEDIAAMVRREVIGLTGVTNEVRTAETYLDLVAGLVDRAQLRDLVLLRLDRGPLIEATGVVPREKIDNWVGFIRAYSNTYSGIIPLRSFVVLDDPAQVAEPGQPIVIGMPEAGLTGAERVLDPTAISTEFGVSAEDLFARPAGPPPTDAPEPGTPLTEQDRLAVLLSQSAEQLETTLGLAPGTIDPAQLGVLRGALANDSIDIATVRALLPAALQDRLDAYLAGDPAATPPGTSPAATPDPTAPLAEDTGEPAAPAFNVMSLLNGSGGLAAALTGAVSDSTEGSPPPGGAAQPAPVQPVTGEDAASAASVALVTGDGLAAPVGPATPDDGALAVVAEEPVAAASVGALPALSNAFMDLSRAAAVVLDQAETGTVTAGMPSLAIISPRLLDLGRREADALSLGSSVLREPALQAQRSGALVGAACWPNSRVTVQEIPTALFWLDVFSTNPAMDLDDLSGENRRLLFELALSPDRIRACLQRLGGEDAQTLLLASVFLQETQRNESFGQFLFRNVPRFALDIRGINLTGERYVVLSDGTKLFEGAAPDLGSRIAAIGDDGVLVRTASGDRVGLYGDQQVAWILE